MLGRDNATDQSINQSTSDCDCGGGTFIFGGVADL